MTESPFLLLPYQQRWQEDKSPVRVAEKSRRIGFSWNSACEMSLEAASTDGQDGWYVGYNKEMAHEFIRDCVWWSQQFDLAASQVEEDIFINQGRAKDKGVLTYIIRFASGHRITALSSRPTSLRGKKGHAILDEAAFHDDLPGLLKSTMAVLMWGGQSRVDIISTHNGVDNPFNQLIEEIRAKKRPYSLHRVTFQDAIAEGLFKRICLMNKQQWSPEREAAWAQELYEYYGDDAREELDCIPARSGGVYLSRSFCEKSMVDEGEVLALEFDASFVHLLDEDREQQVQAWCDGVLAPALEAHLPADRPQFFGEDFGRVSDLTVVCFGYLALNLKRKVHLVLELSKVPFEQQRQVLFFALDRLPGLFAGKLDATGNGSYLAEVTQQRYGEHRIECVSMTAKWYQENLPQLKSAYEDGLIESPRDSDHLIDLNQFKVIEGQPRLPKTRVKSGKGKQMRHGDFAVAMALAYAASCQELGEYDYQATNNRPKGVFDQLGPSYDRQSMGRGLKNRRGGLL